MQVKRPVLVEALVLDRDDGIAHYGCDLVVGHRDPVDVPRVIIGNQVTARVEQLRPGRQLPESCDPHGVESPRCIPCRDSGNSHERQRRCGGQHPRSERDDSEQGNGLAMAITTHAAHEIMIDYAARLQIWREPAKLHEPGVGRPGQVRAAVRMACASRWICARLVDVLGS